MACDLILALDVPSRDHAGPLLRRLRGEIRWVKVGLQLFAAHGPDFVREVADHGYEVFLDLKLHDIPNTVAKAIESLAPLPIRMLTLHTSGGAEMMRAAAQAQARSKPDLLLLGVTVLTSMDASGLRETGVEAAPETQVERLGRLAASAGLRGLVCSPLEVAPLRRILPPTMSLVTPGIRSAQERGGDDQKRVLTPREAAQAGSSYLVVGRPILQASDPVAAVRALHAELAGA